MGKMNHSTYQLNTYTSDWGGGHVGVCVCVCEQGHVRGRFCLRFGGGVDGEGGQHADHL